MISRQPKCFPVIVGLALLLWMGVSLPVLAQKCAPLTVSPRIVPGRPTIVAAVLDQEIETKKMCMPPKPGSRPSSRSNSCPNRTRVTATVQADVFDAKGKTLLIRRNDVFIGFARLIAPAESRRRPALVEVTFHSRMTGTGRNQRIIALSGPAIPVPIDKDGCQWLTTTPSPRQRPNTLADRRSNTGRNTTFIASGGGLGAAAGGITAGTVLGASLGAGVGAGAGLIIALLAQGRDSVVPAEQLIGISLSAVPAGGSGGGGGGGGGGNGGGGSGNSSVNRGGISRYPKVESAQAGYNNGVLQVTAVVHVPMHSEPVYLGDESFSRGVLTLKVRGPVPSSYRPGLVVERITINPVFTWHDPDRRVKRVVVVGVNSYASAIPFVGAPSGQQTGSVNGGGGGGGGQPCITGGNCGNTGGGNPTGGSPTGGGATGGGAGGEVAQINPLGQQINTSLAQLTNNFQTWISASTVGTLNPISRIILNDLQNMSSVAQVFKNPVTAAQRNTAAEDLCRRASKLEARLSATTNVTVPSYFRGQWASIHANIEQLSGRTC